MLPIIPLFQSCVLWLVPASVQTLAQQTGEEIDLAENTHCVCVCGAFAGLLFTWISSLIQFSVWSQESLCWTSAQEPWEWARRNRGSFTGLAVY